MDVNYKRIGALIDRLQQAATAQVACVCRAAYRPCGYEDCVHPPATKDGWQPIQLPFVWGGKWDTHAWFRLHIDAGNEGIGRLVSVSPFPCDGCGEAMQAQFIAYLDGKILCGLDLFHRSFEFEYFGPCDVYLYAYTGMSEREMPFTAECRYVDEPTRQLYYDLSVPYGVLGYADENGKVYADTLTHLNTAVNLLDFTAVGSSSYAASVQAARAYMATHFYGEYCRRQDATTVMVGHSHIDVAWLWPLRQTREKVMRTFSTVLMLMRKYPDFTFMLSQPQLYEFFKQQAPKALWDELVQRVHEGRWEAEGAMWLEADCNLISGESLVRQILLGKRFFRQEFGVDSHVLWLPDVFGYCAALPQILLKSGVDRFVTSKISWNDTNQMPHDAFLWQGIDGSEVFTYFLTAQDKVRGRPPERHTTYIGEPEPRQVIGTYERFQDKKLSDEALNVFGYGDGGGGPTAEHIEKIARMQGGLPGCGNTRIDTVAAFLDTLYKRAKNNPALTKWVGELYLEFHRGTYTSQAANKRNNRKAEFLLQNIEQACELARRLVRADYPQSALDELWKTVLLNQFHDIVPGSSTGPVYEDSRRQYAEVFARGESLLQSATAAVAARVGKSGDTVVFNFCPHPYSGPVRVGDTFVQVSDVPPRGYAVVQSVASAEKVAVGNKTLENAFYCLTFNDGYELISVYDKRARREVLPQGKTGNALVVYDDHAAYEFDAWEMKPNHTEKYWRLTHAESVRPLCEGCRAGYEITRRFDQTEVLQRIYLYDGIDRIDFETTVEARNHNMILKAEFPVDINADTACYDIPFGRVKRPTHTNTSWDAAKFEVCGHKFADLSEGGYGVSLLTDCKYGYDVHDGVMKLTLLRTPTYPDPNADIGTHTFTYALFPHEGALGTATVRQAYWLNNPPVAVAAGGCERSTLPESFGLVRVDASNVIADTIKKAEDGDETVVRLYECDNRRTTARLQFGFAIERASVCNLLETEETPLPVRDNGVEITLRPYEIVTLKLR